jgi:hypothetical protein
MGEANAKILKPQANGMEKKLEVDRSSGQAAAYIKDMAIGLRQLAVNHNLPTLTLILEMAATEANNHCIGLGGAKNTTLSLIR